jgi:replicative DNA helicase
MIQENYLNELFYLILTEKDNYEAVNEHISTDFLPNTQYKTILGKVRTIYKATNKIPSTALLRQHFSLKEAETDLLDKILDSQPTNSDAVLDYFSEFIKRNMFVNAYEDIYELYSNGKVEESYVKMAQSAKNIENFSLKNFTFAKIYKDYDKRRINRELEKLNENSLYDKLPTGITPLDEKLGGGVEAGDLVIFLARSGGGKSYFLKHVGIHTSRMGFHCLHEEIEGTRRQAEDKYDSAWTGSLYRDVKENRIDDGKREKIKKYIKNIKGEIFLNCYERFSYPRVSEVRTHIKDLKKIYGDKLRTVLVDYLELLDPTEGVWDKSNPNQERKRQLMVARELKSLAVEQKVTIFAPTQASDVLESQFNNPDFVLRRSHLAENKNKLEPADILLTGNQTDDEKDDKIYRIWIEKMREGDANQLIYIKQNLALSRFYDSAKTMKEFYDQYDND